MLRTTITGLTMTDKNFRSADITTGMVALLWEMPGAYLVDVFKELVRRRDIESLQVVLESETVQKRPWADIPFHLLPLKDSDDPRAREFYTSWSARMSGQDPGKMAHRLLYLVGMNDRHEDKRAEIADEIVQLMKLGVDVESPIAKAQRTSVGHAINEDNVHTGALIINEFAKQHPDRLPLAAKGKDVVEYLVTNRIDHHETAGMLSRIAGVYDFSQESLKAKASKAFSKMIGAGKLSDSSNCLANVIALVGHDMINAEAMADLWNKASVDRFVTGAPFLLSLAKRSHAGNEEQALLAFSRFVENGIDIDAPLSNGSHPIDYMMGFGSDKFFATVLEAGVDLKLLQERIKAKPDMFVQVPGERIAMANALLARRQVMDVVSAAQRPRPA